MKSKFLILLTIFSLFMSSCKDKKDGATEEKQPVTVNTTNFKFTINAVVKKDDDFQMFYKEDGNLKIPFDEISSIHTSLKGSENAQDIIFNLPEDVFPTNLRLDVGTNREQSDIIIKGFKMEYKGKVFEINGSDFFNYFRPDETFIKIDKPASKAIPFITKDGNYDPMFFSMENMDKEMVKLSR